MTPENIKEVYRINAHVIEYMGIPVIVRFFPDEKVGLRFYTPITEDLKAKAYKIGIVTRFSNRLLEIKKYQCFERK